MRTLLIAPSFLAVFTVAIFSLGWLITEGAESVATRNGASLPPWAFTGWVQSYPPGPAMTAPKNHAIHDQIEELSLH